MSMPAWIAEHDLTEAFEHGRTLEKLELALSALRTIQQRAEADRLTPGKSRRIALEDIEIEARIALELAGEARLLQAGRDCMPGAAHVDAEEGLDLLAEPFGAFAKFYRRLPEC